MDVHKTYARWAYGPTSADVTLSFNDEGHPSSIRLYSDLEKERPERDLLFGYAIRTPQGWNVFDWDNHPVEDPNQLWKIREALREQVR